VRVTVIEKRLEWKSDILDLTGDQLDRGYFKLHPNGMVPTLVRRRMSALPADERSVARAESQYCGSTASSLTSTFYRHASLDSF
jgi:hypothetical protein